MDSSCVFCQIVAGEAPASHVYEDERVTAFLDHDPINPGHTLVVPKSHAASLADLSGADAAGLLPAGQRIAAALRATGLRCDGISLHLADGASAGQEVFHVHLHVFPRWRGDGVRLRPPGRTPYKPPRTELEVIAAALRERLGRSA